MTAVNGNARLTWHKRCARDRLHAKPRWWCTTITILKNGLKGQHGALNMTLNPTAMLAEYVFIAAAKVGELHTTTQLNRTSGYSMYENVRIAQLEFLLKSSWTISIY